MSLSFAMNYYEDSVIPYSSDIVYPVLSEADGNYENMVFSKGKSNLPPLMTDDIQHHHINHPAQMLHKDLHGCYQYAQSPFSRDDEFAHQPQAAFLFFTPTMSRYCSFTTCDGTFFPATRNASFFFATCDANAMLYILHPRDGGDAT
jgi:hypothetical protein